MTTTNRILALWQRLSGLPGGKWMFSRLVCLNAPYFGSIRPMFETLEPGRSAVRIKKRRAVLNHIGTVHAIAMCNMAELAAGTVTDVSIPATHRWIPKGMTVKYLKKAETNLRAVAQIGSLADLQGEKELPVNVDVTDARDQLVFNAVITMWLSPKKA